VALVKPTNKQTLTAGHESR